MNMLSKCLLTWLTFFFSSFKFSRSFLISETAVIYKSVQFVDLSLNYCTLNEKQDKSKIECMAKCLQVEGCSTFSHNAFTLSCRLYSVNFGSVVNGTVELGWLFYIVKGSVCPDHYTLEQSTCTCFKYYGSGVINHGTFYEKQNHCRDEGAQLIRIDTPELQKAMEEYLVWINAERALIQGYYLTTGFQFDNGDNITYIPWDAGEPDPLNGNETKVLTLRPPLYRWSDTTYSSVKNYGFICQFV